MIGRVVNIPGFLICQAIPGLWMYCNHRFKIMKHFKILLCFDSLQVKWYMNSSTENIVYKLPLEFSNNLRLTILENRKLWKNFKNELRQILYLLYLWYSTFEEKNFVTNGQKLHENRYQISFLSCPILLISWYCFINFVRDCRICLNNFWKCLVMCEYALICLNMPKYTWMYLNMPESLLFYMPPL